jgi:AbrB family looped-hinge helix DNA binding protein
MISRLWQEAANLSRGDDMTAHRARIAEGGRVVIPAEFRRQLDLQPGAEVILDVTDGDLRIRSLRRAIERARPWCADTCRKAPS